MTSEETIEKRLEKLAQTISPDEALIENVMSRINAKPIAGPSIGPAQNIWRTIMKSPITKLAAAAAIIIACFTGLYLWKGTASDILLADVLDKLEQVETYRYNIRTTIKKQTTSQEKLSTILVSRGHGIKIIETRDPNNSESQPAEMYILPQQNVMVVISHEHSFYSLIKFDDENALEEYKEENNDPHTIVKNLLSCDQTRLGQSTIDGIKVEGFRITDPNYAGSFVKTSDLMGKAEQAVVELWVDVKTQLPVRLVEDIVKKDGVHFHEVSYDFKWNVDIKAEDFNPTKPEGYTSTGDGLIFPASNEQTTIKGLRLFSSLAKVYPTNLSYNNLNAESNKILGIEGKPAWETYSKDEANKLARDFATLDAPGIFYEELVDKERDPAYYGDAVRPSDADKVLLRWKLDDGQYRVIFGDLSAKTITHGELAEFEKP